MANLDWDVPALEAALKQMESPEALIRTFKAVDETRRLEALRVVSILFGGPNPYPFVPGGSK